MPDYENVTFMVFPNGNTVVFDEKGNQIVDLQRGWLDMLMTNLKSNGVKSFNLDKSILPDGRKVSSLFGV